MRMSVLSRPLVATALLFAAACGGAGTPNADIDNEAAINDVLANADETVPESVNQTGEGVDLVALPPAPADVPATEAAPLTQAAQIAGEIDSGTAVERVPYEGGWAWRRGGRIVRTASRDGRRVAYFRPGESVPFLVQQGEETFAYAGGRPQRSFDRRGRPGALPPERQAEARRLADQSRHDRDQAEHAPRQTGTANDRGGRHGDQNGAARGDNGAAQGDDHNGANGSNDRDRTRRPDCNDRRPAAGRDPRCRDRRPRDDNGNHQ